MIDALIAFFEISLVGTKMCVIKKPLTRRGF